MVTESTILAHYKQSLRTIVEIYFPNYISSEVLFQLDKDKLLYPVVFFSKNLNHTKCNHKIYDKKPLAIIQYFE